MTREEALAAGWDVQEIKHSMKRRSPWHDYSRKGTYLLTLVVRERAALLGCLKGDMDGSRAPYVELSGLGSTIAQEELPKINRFYPQVEVWKLCVMPDHLHLIVRVKEDMGAGKHLGMVVAGFKGGCSKAAMRLGVAVPCASALDGDQGGRPGNGGNWWLGNDGNRGTGNGGTGKGGRVVPLFEEGYCDKILLHDGQLDNWKHYLDDNPRRLMMKRKRPDLFTVRTDLEVDGVACQAVGNRFLLDIPDKMAVVVHRRYTDEEYARRREEWLACGERGGVLVGAAIAPREKEVMREAMNRGYGIILLRENGFAKLYKPAGESFDACAEGRLLEISPWDFHMEKRTISREECLYLNAMAERIALGGAWGKGGEQPLRGDFLR